MAARKHQPKPRGASRNSGSAPARKPVPGWLWLVAGAAIGGFFVFLAQLKPGGDGVKHAPAGKEAAASAAKPAAPAQPAQPAAPPKPKYDFYTLLPQSSNPSAMMQAPNEDQVRSNEAARAQALLDGRNPPPRLVMAPPAGAPQPAGAANAQPATNTAPPASQPPANPPAPKAPAPSAAAAPAPAPTPAAKPAPAPAPAAKPQPAAAPSAPAAQPGGHFYLQAGSYASREQADTARARLTLLGQSVRVESGKVGDKTWHRVVLGPFASRQQAESTQKDLKSSGVGSVLQQRH